LRADLFELEEHNFCGAIAELHDQFADVTFHIFCVFQMYLY